MLELRLGLGPLSNEESPASRGFFCKYVRDENSGGLRYISPIKRTEIVSIDLDKAREIALGYLKALESEVGQELSIASYEPAGADGGWIFFYNTSAYIGNGNISHALAGNGPLFVERDGRLTALSSSGNWKDEIKGIRGGVS